MFALTHAPSPRLEECQLTFVARDAIDYDRALQQHAAYCRMLADCGAVVRQLDVNRDQPDGVFIEDTAVVLDELAILARPGAASRRNEPAAIEPVLGQYRQLHRIEAPATLEGGDVLRIGRTLLAGLSTRTNRAGVDQLARLAGRFGYDVRTVPVNESLHLKTACTALPDGRLLVNPQWLDVSALCGYELIAIPPDEPFGANVALIGDIVCIAAEHLQSAALIRRLGFELRSVELSEFGKAEGGATCLSLLVP
ncbi:MAG: dimethylargininase [Planctomycetaceae bacterium]|nr:dimethylargininase [Planctomycetaceae bacterium]